MAWCSWAILSLSRVANREGVGQYLQLKLKAV